MLKKFIRFVSQTTALPFVRPSRLYRYRNLKPRPEVLISPTFRQLFNLRFSFTSSVLFSSVSAVSYVKNTRQHRPSDPPGRAPAQNHEDPRYLQLLVPRASPRRKDDGVESVDSMSRRIRLHFGAYGTRMELAGLAWGEGFRDRGCYKTLRTLVKPKTMSQQNVKAGTAPPRIGPGQRSCVRIPSDRM